MSSQFPQAAAGDNILTAVNALASATEAAVNSADGASLIAASVATSKLAKPKALLGIPFSFDGDLEAAGSQMISQWVLPNIDGAVNGTWVYLSSSLACKSQAAVAGSTIILSENGTTKHTIDLNNTTYNATAVDAAPAAPVTTASAKIWKAQYTKGGAGALTGVHGVAWFSLNHVGT